MPPAPEPNPDDPLKEIDKGAGERQGRPITIGGRVHQHQPAAIALLSRDQRRAVFEPRPALGGERWSGLGQDLTGDHHVVFWNAQAAERAVLIEAGKRQGSRPGERAVEKAITAPERYRHQIVELGIGEPWAGKTKQHAPLIDPIGKG